MVTIRADSREWVGVQVTASVPLGGQAVSIGIGATLHSAAWTGASAVEIVKVVDGVPVTFYRRTARVLVGPGGAPSVATLTAGTYRVAVKVTDSPEVPVVDAYTLHVQDVPT